MLFFSLSYVALAGFVDIDTNRMNETQWQDGQLKNSSTTITLPASALKETPDGRLVLNLPDGGGGGWGGWGDWKKNRPFFMDESLMQVSDGGIFFWEALENIRQSLESPMSRDEVKEQQERLDALEIELEAYRRQQEAEALTQQFGVQGEGAFFFRNHPGYQENHPAHPSKEQVHTVPGILGAPRAGEEAGAPPANTGSSTNSGRTEGSFDSAGKGGAGTGANRGASGGGGGEKTPERSGVKNQENKKNGLHLVTKELSDGTELEAYVDDNLFCSACQDLVASLAAQCVGCSNSDSGKCRDQCEGCEAIFCREHVDTVETCPCCRHQLNSNTYNKVAKSRELRNINWTCTKCGQGGAESEMEGHGLQCNKKHLVSCKHEGCEACVSMQDIREHEESCNYRLVDFGCYQVAHWQKKLIESVRVPDNLRFENVDENQAAEMSVGLLIALVFKQPLRKVAEDCAWGCGFQGQGQEELQQHYVTCPYVLGNCNYCGFGVERRQLAAHVLACNQRPVDCPNGCEIEGLVARQLREHSKVCEMHPVACELCANEFARQTLESHASECPCKPARCDGCFSEMILGKLSEHEKSCILMLAGVKLGDCWLNRQSGAKNAVYEPVNGSNDEVYLILPVRLILDAVKKLEGHWLLHGEVIKFTWNNCQYHTCFDRSSGFSIRPSPQENQGQDVRAYIDILSENSQLLGRMQTNLCQEDIICVNNPANKGGAVLYNTAGLEGYRGQYCAIHIHKIKK